MFPKHNFFRITVIFLGIFLIACDAGIATQEDRVDNYVQPAEPEFLLVTPPENDWHCERPYAENSIWNLPIDWSIARYHPLSDEMISAFFDGTSWVGSDASQYAPPVYYVTSADELVPVKLRENSFRDAIDDQTVQFGEPASTVWLPIPKGAQPAPGTDAELVVVNIDSGEEWGLIKVDIDLAGNWSAGGVYRYHLLNSGIPPVGFAHRGAGIGSLAGIIRPCEVEQGYIRHAVTLAYDSPCEEDVCKINGWLPVIPPFTKTDGEGKSKYDIPEGARIIIKPDISKSEIHKACSEVKGCVLWVLAMQIYGGFIVDNSGHPKTYAEGDATANWDPNVWNKDMLRNIPPDWYAVLDWSHPSALVP